MALSVAVPASDPDAAFVQALSAGSSRLLALAIRMVGDEQDARDVLQEAWLRAWRARGTLRTPEALDGWLRCIVARECLRTLRWRHVRRLVGLGYDDAVTADPGPGPERTVDAARQAARVRRAVATLSPKQRLVWGLRFDEGWTVGEIAAATGLKPDTVKTHLGRALENVHARLESPHGL